MGPAFPASDYYDGSAPGCALRQASHLSANPFRANGAERIRFPRSLAFDQRVRHPALPLRHHHGYAVDLHRDLPAPAGETEPGVPLRHIGQRVRTAHLPLFPWFEQANISRGVTTPVPRVYLLVSLTGPGPSRNPEPSRLCHGCSHPHHQSMDQAAVSFSQQLRLPADEGLPPPFELQAPRGAPLY